METLLDLDGSGPLPPFSARCEFLPGNRNLTFIGHLNEAQTKVDGFDEKGSFLQVINFQKVHFIHADKLKFKKDVGEK